MCFCVWGGVDVTSTYKFIVTDCIQRILGDEGQKRANQSEHVSDTFCSLQRSCFASTFERVRTNLRLLT